jgi:hypothetical protein
MDSMTPLACVRVNLAWSAQWVRRTLPDEPGKGMGSPFSQAEARLFALRAGLLASDQPLPPPGIAETLLLERMSRWLEANHN